MTKKQNFAHINHLTSKGNFLFFILKQDQQKKLKTISNENILNVTF